MLARMTNSSMVECEGRAAGCESEVGQVKVGGQTLSHAC